jgi:ectoine hydroxylase-related dioxygenase (phytanoyl-CoA dioxygenase family)
MQFIPRTHKLGVVPHERKNKFYLEIAEDHLQRYLNQAIDIPLEPGDVVLFSNLLFHRGLPNSSNSIRWSCDGRYQDSRQPTLRSEVGHIARSRTNSESSVRDADHWSRLSFR